VVEVLVICVPTEKQLAEGARALVGLHPATLMLEVPRRRCVGATGCSRPAGGRSLERVHLTRAASAAALAGALVLTGCSAGAGGPASVPDAPSEASPAVIDVAALPLGAPARVPTLVDGVLRWRGRTVRTAFPADAAYPELLGAVDGRPVVTALSGKGVRSGDRFWSIGPDGSLRRLGGTYPTYDYGPRLVAATGHLWAQHTDRTSPLTLWEVDARTGRQLAVYHRRAPHGLAPADQALVDAWVQRRRAVPETEDRTRDGELKASLGTPSRAPGSYADVVVVRRTSDHAEVARFAFAVGEVGGGVQRVVFEDDAHVLALVTLSSSVRRGTQQAVVRCDVATGACERTTEVSAQVALGVVRPRFHP
jgi:hypothetical protein